MAQEDKTGKDGYFARLIGTAKHELASPRFLVEILALIGVAIYVAYTIQIYHATKQSADAATESLKVINKQFQIDQRPYISVLGYDASSGTQSKSPPIKGKPFLVTIFFKNIGKGPAVDVETQKHLLFETHLSEFRVPFPEYQFTGSTLDPGIGNNTVAVSLKDTYAEKSQGININSSDLINWDGSDVIVYGRFIYKDRFGNSYCTAFMTSPLYPTNKATQWVNMRDLKDATGKFVKVANFCPADTN
jgi:hypothetical protein